MAVYRQSFPAIATNTTTSSKQEDPLPATSSFALDDSDAPYVDSSKKAVVALKHRGGGNTQDKPQETAGKAN